MPYIDGNTVRKRSEERRKNRARKIINNREKNRQKIAAERSYQRAAIFSISWFEGFLIIATIVFSIFMGYKYLTLDSQLNKRMSNVQSLTSQLEKLKNENDELEQNIESKITIDDINEIVEKYHLKRANGSEVIMFNKNETEYVQQGEDI
jgi:cell division protein FtsL